MTVKHRIPGDSAWTQRRLLWLAREVSLTRWMHAASTHGWLVRVLSTLSRIGDGWVWYASVVLLPLFGGVSGPSAAVRMFAVGAIDIVLYGIVKRWIARPRPARACEGIRECARALDEFSFPSGHTMHAVACCIILSSYYPALAVFVWPFTVLIGLSRVILGLHYPSDVIVGAVIGATTALISFNLL